MDVSGYPRCALIWKPLDMPSGPPICRLRASARGTRDSDCGLLPTPQTVYDGRSEEAWKAARRRADEKRRSGQYAKGCGTPAMVDLQRAIGGPPNPTWVAWLMGYPSAWINSAPSAMPSSRKSRPSSSALRVTL
jgi:hypothetical protein